LLLIGHGEYPTSCGTLNAQSIANGHFLPAGEHRGEEILIKSDGHAFILQLGRSTESYCGLCPL